MNQSENINELMAALAKAQGEMNGALKDSANPFFKSKYADLSSVWDACRQPLSKNGLAVVQLIETDQEGEMSLMTTLGHSSGQWMRSKIPIKINASKEGRVNELQLLGSALTYLRRFALSAIVGVAPADDSDDDGNESGKSADYSSKKNRAERVHIDSSPKAYVTQAQAKELEAIVNECSEKYITNIKKRMEERKMSYTTFPADEYDKFLLNAKKERDQHLAFQKEHERLLKTSNAA